MRTSRVRFKYALCFTRNIEDTARVDSLAKDLSDDTIDGFWDNVRKLNSGIFFHANTIAGVSSETDISNFWKDPFYKLLNANNCDTILKSSIISKLDVGGYMLAKTRVVFYVWSPDIFVLSFYLNLFQALRILLCQIKHYHTIPLIMYRTLMT